MTETRGRAETGKSRRGEEGEGDTRVEVRRPKNGEIKDEAKQANCRSHSQDFTVGWGGGKAIVFAVNS